MHYCGSQLVMLWLPMLRLVRFLESTVNIAVSRELNNFPNTSVYSLASTWQRKYIYSDEKCFPDIASYCVIDRIFAECSEKRNPECNLIGLCYVGPYIGYSYELFWNVNSSFRRAFALCWRTCKYRTRNEKEMERCYMAPMGYSHTHDRVEIGVARTIDSLSSPMCIGRYKNITMWHRVIRIALYGYLQKFIWNQPLTSQLFAR